MTDRASRIRHVVVQLNGIIAAYRRASVDRLQHHFVLKRAGERVIILVADNLALLEDDDTHLTSRDLINLAGVLTSDRPTVSHLQLWDMITVRFPRLRCELEAALLRETLRSPESNEC